MSRFGDSRFFALKFLFIGIVVFSLYSLLPAKVVPARRLSVSAPDYSPFALNHFTIGMNPEDLKFWFSDRPQSLFVYQAAEFALNRLPRKYNCEIRIRGTHAWNWDLRKPSFRLKLSRNQTIFGGRMVDLINPDDASMLANLVADNIAFRIGLPSPRTRLCTLTLNQDYKGLYHLAEPINVGTLLNQGFGSHSVIEGNIRNSKMWLTPEMWQIEIQAGASEIQPRDCLKMMLDFTKTPVCLDKLEGLSQIIDLELTARWSALMSAIASIHTNDFIGNLLIFDHSTGKLFPAIADSTGFGVITAMAGKHDKIDIEVPPYEFLSPLQNALFRIPEFQYRRNLYLYELLQNHLHPHHLTELVNTYLEVLRPLFFKEPYASALINIPLVLFSRKIPVSPQTQLEDAQRLLDFMKQRRTFLLQLLKSSLVRIVPGERRSNVKGKVFRHFAVMVSGHSPVEFDLEKLPAEILPDLDFDGNPDQAAFAREVPLMLFPALKEVKKEAPHWLMVERRFAGFILEPEFQTYVFAAPEEKFSDCIRVLQNSCINSICRNPARVEVATTDAGAEPQPASQVLHPWRNHGKN